MVKRLILPLAALMLLIVIVLSSVGFWILRTPQGARWLLETAADAAGAQMEISRVEGRLADDLLLQGIRLRREGTEAMLDRLHLQWQPGRLLQGDLAVSELSLEGGDVLMSPKPSSEKEGPAEISWPRLSGWALRLGAVIERLHLENITFHPPKGESRNLDKVTARVAWDEGILKVSALDAAGEGYRLQGEFAAGFVSPLLQLELRLLLPEAVADLDDLRLTANLQEGDEALLFGPVELRGGKGEKTILDLNAQIALSEEVLRLRSFELTHVSWGGVLLGEGAIDLTDPFVFSLRTEAQGVDLARETGVEAVLAGRMEISGILDDYDGDFDLSSAGAGWLEGRLTGRFSGTSEGIDLRDLDGRWLRGSLGGETAVGWHDGIRVHAMLKGRDLDPAVFNSQLSGRVNLDLEGDLAKLPGEALHADVKGEMLDSTLRSRPLTGRADLSLRGEDLRIAALELHGDGFDLDARGRLRERVEVSADVRRLDGLIPGTAGSLQARGWLRWRDGEAAGRLGLQGESLDIAEVRAASVRGAVNWPAGRSFDVRLQADGVAYERLSLGALEVALAGTPERHELNLKVDGREGRGELSAEGGWRGRFWAGTLERLEGRTRQFGDWRLVEPVELQAGARNLKIESMRLRGSGDMDLQVAAEMAGSPLQGTLAAAWRGIDLVFLAPLMPEEMKVAGQSSGKADLRLQGDQTALFGRIEAAGRVAHGEFSAAFSRVEGTVDWDAGGLDARLEAELEEGGRLAANVNSDEPPPAVPQRGRLAAKWEGIDLSRLRPWLPSNLGVKGELSGQTQGDWRPGQRLALTGRVGIGDGVISWQQEEGEVSFSLRTAEAGWRWQGESLEGDLDLALAEVGRIAGDFSVPLPARLPTAPLPQGPLSVRLSGEMREQGLLSAIFPGLLRESEGELAAQLNIGGTWRSPDFGGRLSLSGAGAYLPMAGIEIDDVQVRAELSGQRVHLVAFSARSGPGRIEGEGEVRLEQWRLAEYRATLKGERFQFVNLPELQLLVSPDLILRGNPEQLTLRGEVRVPELILIERKRAEMIQESPDVIVVGEETSAERGELPIDLDIEVRVVLGKRVLIKYAGVDARLDGALRLIAQGVEDITGRGEISVEEGIYSAYGVRLRIVRGRILFAGGPVDLPTLDILALRTIGEVKAGVQVGGTPREPVVNLYSDPAMAETDVLSYIVLGHPMGGDRQSAGLLLGAASALLSQGESAVLQDRLKRGLGLDVLTVDSGGGEVETSMVTIGKYLSPSLYISYGQSLFSGTSEAMLRYEISKKWQLESKMGEESGVDLFYKIEFK